MLRNLLTPRPGRLLAVVLCTALAAVPASGASRDVGVGSEGEIYTVQKGAYGELFPEEGLASPDNSALALEVNRSDGTTERLLVPGTETGHIEDSPSILFEDESGTLFLLWHSKVNVIHSQLNLIGFRDGAWTESIEVSGNPFSWKSSPQLAVSRESFQAEEPDGSLRTRQRTVVHLLWWEEGVDREPLVQYTPVVLVDGVYTGWNPVYSLADLDPVEGEGLLPSLNLALAQVPRIESGTSSHRVVIGYVEPVTGELRTLSLDVLPGELAFLADRVRHQISEIGRELLPDQPEVLADRVRHQISEIGNRLNLHPSLTSYLASRIFQEISAASPSDDPAVIAERARHQISEIGARVSDRGLGRVATQEGLRILEVPNYSSDESASLTHLISVMHVSARPAPDTGFHGLVMYLSQSGREVLVAWVEDGTVYYRETRREGWSSVRSLVLSDEFDLSRAYEVLERRAHERVGE